MMGVLGFLALLRLWFMGPMWLDEAFVSFGYADRIARGDGPFLLGNDASTERFTNPLWVALFGVVGGLNIREADVQLPLSVIAYLGLLYLVLQVIREHASVQVAVLSASLLGIAPVAASVRDGTDLVCLAALSTWAARSASRDLKSPSERRTTAYLLGILSWSGLFGLMVALGFAVTAAVQGRWRNLRVVAAMFACLTVVRWLLYATWLPPLPLGELSFAPFEWFRAWSLLVVVGVILAIRSERMLYGWIVCVGWGLASYGPVEDAAFGASIVPTVGAMAVLFAETWTKLPIKGLGVIMMFLVFGLDGTRAERALEGVRTERLSHYLQSKAMGRFLLWRFGPDDLVVVHRPGVVGYYSRRPLIDLSGRIHENIPSPEEALGRNPSAVLPDRSIVSQKAQRLIMNAEWPTQLDERYKQYAIQHQKAWQMVDVDPVWFHIYIRKDLPMLRPEIPKSNGNILPSKNPFGDP